VYAANQESLRLVNVSTSMEDVLSVIRPSTTQWIRIPGGESHWISVSPEYGVKVVMDRQERQWGWADREDPTSLIHLERNPPGNSSLTNVHKVGDVYVAELPGADYASVDTSGDKIPCQATARGGSIDVTCSNDEPGVLTVNENDYSGWAVWRDGERAPLIAGPHLSTDAPAGQHRFEFRYRPWDVPLGVWLTLIGIALSVWLWRTRSEYRFFDGPPREEEGAGGESGHAIEGR
jgi:hypothetical protein